jgi:glycosyltransferase involved in cell wall biosynthesis
MKKVAFICDLKYPEIWKDGLWAALQLLQNDYEVSIINLHERIEYEHNKRLAESDCIIAWSAFSGSCVHFVRNSGLVQPKLLCIGGTAAPPDGAELFDVLFYETHWYEDIIRHISTKKIHAFGVNTDIYCVGVSSTFSGHSERVGIDLLPELSDGGSDSGGSIPVIDGLQRPINQGDTNTQKIFDVLSVGSFSLWKRHERIIGREGVKLVIGEVQRENRAESYSIIQKLLESGVIVSDMLPPEKLVEIYRSSKLVYIPAELHGGGERAILEARACGIPVEFESDNPKLEELSTSPIYDHHYYAQQLKKGIEYATRR